MNPMIVNIVAFAMTTALLIGGAAVEVADIGTVDISGDAMIIAFGPRAPAFSFGGFIVGSRRALTEARIAHEYGHVLQQRMYGSREYIGRVAIPSAFTNVLFMATFDESIMRNYQSFPWEAEANHLGETE